MKKAPCCGRPTSSARLVILTTYENPTRSLTNSKGSGRTRSEDTNRQRIWSTNIRKLLELRFSTHRVCDPLSQCHLEGTAVDCAPPEQRFSCRARDANFWAAALGAAVAECRERSPVAPCHEQLAPRTHLTAGLSFSLIYHSLRWVRTGIVAARISGAHRGVAVRPNRSLTDL